MPPTDWSAAIITFAADKLTQQYGQIARCAQLLTNEEVWHRANANTNSVGNLILHLTGNVRQWLCAGLGGEAFERDRPTEFAVRGPRATGEILASLEDVVRRGVAVLLRQNAATLQQRYTIQGYDVAGVVAVFHVVEHFSLHTGQIVHITKLLRDVDLSLYDEQGRRHAGDGP